MISLRVLSNQCQCYTKICEKLGDKFNIQNLKNNNDLKGMDHGDTLKISEPATSFTIIILNYNLYQFKKINILAKLILENKHT